MGATIMACQVKPVEGIALSTSAPSSFIKSIEDAFGTFPKDFDKEDIPVLRGMAAMNNQQDNPYQELIDLIEQYHLVRIWAEY